MNLAGAISLLLGRGASIEPGALDEAFHELLESPADTKPDDLASEVDGLAGLLTPVPLEQMHRRGTVGLLVGDRDRIASALAGDDVGRQPDADELFVTAVDVDDDRILVYPQDTRPDSRIVVWAPVAAGPDSLRLARLDLGYSVGSGFTEAPLVEPESCAFGFSGLDSGLRKACFPGTCSGSCQERWSMRRDGSTVLGCSCDH